MHKALPVAASEPALRVSDGNVRKMALIGSIRPISAQNKIIEYSRLIHEMRVKIHISLRAFHWTKFTHRQSPPPRASSNPAPQQFKTCLINPKAHYVISWCRAFITTFRQPHGTLSLSGLTPDWMQNPFLRRWEGIDCEAPKSLGQEKPGKFLIRIRKRKWIPTSGLGWSRVSRLMANRPDLEECLRRERQTREPETKT